jgi:MinD-like ATPase involved in chromosome partitioning or flagellar assembly
MSGESKEPQEEEPAADTAAPPNAWTNTPPAPTFPPPYPGPPSQDPSVQPPAEGQQPYGYGAPGYPPHDFGVHQPPQFPGAPAQDYGGFPQYPAPEPGAPQPYDAAPQPYDHGPANGGVPYDAAPPNGAGPYDARQAPPSEPQPRYEPGDAEETQFVEQRPAAEATQADTGYEGYADGGYQGYQQYPAPQFGQQPEAERPGPPYSAPPFFSPPPGSDQGTPYPGPQQFEQGPPYPGPQQFGDQPNVEQAPYPGPYYARQPDAEQGPPLAPLPEAYAQQQGGPQTADALSADMLLRGRRHAPAGGWRRVLYKATGGAVHPGESPGELRRRELLVRARTPVAGGHHRVAVMSLKGGVGKTTSTVGLGATLASMRGDRVIAVDANPDRGTLSDKVRLETATTVRDLLNEHRQIQRYADVRAYTSQASSRLEVLASDRDPAVSEAFSEDDYRTVAHVLEHFYSICLTDCGTGLLHSAMAGVLGLANQLVLVSSPSVDGARSASATLDWLEAHHYGDLVRNGVVVLSMVRSRSRSTVDLDRLQAHFESRCRAVVRIPYDPHLEEGAEVELDQLSPATQDAYLVLAATVGDGFAWPH